MKLPHTVLSHCLAHGPAVTPEILDITLPHDWSFGYGGQVIVAACTQPEDHDGIIAALKRHRMSSLICGFMAGQGPDPLREFAAASAVLRIQMRLARKLYLAGVGPNGMVGPTHTHHMVQRASFDKKELAKWIAMVDELRQEEGLDWVCFEPLNPTEDGTPDPFRLLAELIAGYPALAIQWDTGHAHARGLDANDLLHMVRNGLRVKYLEFANVGRSPLDVPRGIDFELDAKNAAECLADDCLVGDEPFDGSVIKAFKLPSKICDTEVVGVECLARDAETLRKLGFLPEHS
jgi:hypothetical protein